MSAVSRQINAPLKQHLAALTESDRWAAWANRYGEAEAIAARFQATANDVRKLCRDLEKSEAAVGFVLLKTWHDAVLVRQDLSATEKVAALRVWSFVNHAHLYAWPSQDRLAQELGYSRGPNLGKALRRSFEIGAFTPVRIKNLPVEVRKAAVEASRRSTRGIAYRLNPVDRWLEESANFTALQNSHMFHGGTLKGSVAHHLNREGNHQPASPDSLHSRDGNPSSAFQHAEPHQYGIDKGKTYG